MLKRIYLQCIATAVVVFVFVNAVAYSARDIATANAVEIQAVEAMKPGEDENFSGEAPLGDLSESDQDDLLILEESSEESSSASDEESSELSSASLAESGSTSDSSSGVSTSSGTSSVASSSSSSASSSQSSLKPPVSNTGTASGQPPTSNSYVTPPESVGGSKPAASTSSGSSKPTSSSSKPTTSSSKPTTSSSKPTTSSSKPTSSSSKPTSSSSKPTTSSSKPTTSSSKPTTSSSKPASSSSSKPSSSTPSSKPSGETFRISVSGEAKELDAYDAVCRVVEGEMGGSFHVEALKAQALAAYSYLKEQNGKGVTPVLPLREPSQKVINAVAAVWGEAIYSGNSIAFTPYHASSAGYTNSSTDVWGGSYRYLTAVESAYDPSSNNKNVTVVIPAGTLQAGLESVLGITMDENDPESWMEIVSTNDSGYVLSVRITDASGGSHMTTGRKIRESVLGYKLKSHAFTVTYANGSFTFVTNGYGHGVGMSQTGANGYAVNDGWNYQDILSHYYPGTSVR